MTRLGVAIVGINGAVSSTVIAGVKMMAAGLVQRNGMLTEPAAEKMNGKPDGLTDLLSFAALEDMVFGGWDIHDTPLYDAALHHGVFRADQLEPVREALSAIRPWPAVFGRDYYPAIDGEHKAGGSSHRAQIECVKKDLTRFCDQEKLDRVVLVNLASTETYLEVGPVHETLAAFEKGLDANAPEITPLMRYTYAANDLGMPHANFTPSLANVPALKEQAVERGVPFAGMDGKTGQTLVKTALGPMFRARRLHVEGWYSINFLGNNDGLVLNEPGANKTKVKSKSSVLDSVVGHTVENHQVHIHYYKPRGDAKEAWDNIDIRGFAGMPMQMKVNFLCQDSVLAAPLVVDLVRLLDVAQERGERGIQNQLSLYFKSPYHEPGEQPVHDLFEQHRMLFDWARKVASAQPGTTEGERLGAGRPGSGPVEHSL